MPQLAPVMLTAEQFNQLATKDYLDKTLDERLKGFASKDFIDTRLKHFATKDDLKNFATKDDISSIKEDVKQIKSDILTMKIDISVQKIISQTLKLSLDSLAGEMESRFNQVDYKIDTSFAHLDKNLNETCLNHEIRIKKLESKFI